MLEARSQIHLVQQDLNWLFHNRRVNAAGVPLFIGLLPSAAAMILCGDRTGRAYPENTASCTVILCADDRILPDPVIALRKINVLKQRKSPYTELLLPALCLWALILNS